MKSKRSLLALCGVVAALAAAAFCAIRFYPLETFAAKARFEIWLAGARSFDVPTSRGEIHFFAKNDCRAGEPCRCALLIHGAADTAMTWKSLLTASASALPGLSLYAVDLPGSGDSPAPRSPSELRVRIQAATLREAIAPLPCSSWTAVGNSFGGWIAEWLALDAKDKVDSLVIVDGAGLRATLQDSQRTSTTFLHPTEEAMKDFQRRAYYRPRPIPEYVWKEVVERMSRANSADLFGAQVLDDAIDAHMTEITQPTLVVWGEADQVIPRSDGIQLAHGIPHARLATIGECGHMPQKECPKPLEQAITSFLAKAR